MAKDNKKSLTCKPYAKAPVKIFGATDVTSRAT